MITNFRTAITMNSAIERVAKALFNRDHPGILWENAHPVTAIAYRNEAKKLIFGGE